MNNKVHVNKCPTVKITQFEEDKNIIQLIEWRFMLALKKHSQSH